MKLPEFSRHAPLGFDLSIERGFYLTGLICATVYSMGFFVRYVNALDELYAYENRERFLLDTAVMPDFVDLLGGALWGFLALAVAMLAFAVYHYAYHRQGSNAFYLMRRLPKRFELHRRCLALPIGAALGCALCAFVLLLLYFGIYLLFTPRECVQPEQWYKIWRNFL